MLGRSRDLDKDPPEALGTDEAKRALRSDSAWWPSTQTWADREHLAMLATERGIKDYKALYRARHPDGSD